MMKARAGWWAATAACLPPAHFFSPLAQHRTPLFPLPCLLPRPNHPRTYWFLPAAFAPCPRCRLTYNISVLPRVAVVPQLRFSTCRAAFAVRRRYARRCRIVHLSYANHSDDYTSALHARRLEVALLLPPPALLPGCHAFATTPGRLLPTPASADHRARSQTPTFILLPFAFRPAACTCCTSMTKQRIRIYHPFTTCCPPHPHLPHPPPP